MRASLSTNASKLSVNLSNLFNGGCKSSFFIFIFFYVLVKKTQLVRSLQAVGTFPGQVSNKITSQVRETAAEQSSVPQACKYL